MVKAYTPTNAAKKIGITRAMTYRLEKRGLLTRIKGSPTRLFTAQSVEALSVAEIGTKGRKRVIPYGTQLL